jgi:hypothetical protein
LANAEDGTQDGILWDDSEQSVKGASFSEIKKIVRNVNVTENFKFAFQSGIFSITFHFKYFVILINVF